MKRNASVTTELRTARFTEEHFSLYRRYQSVRHTGDSMDDPDPGKYRQFLMNSNIDTFILELRIGRRLLSVSVIDHVANGLSAVYTFYDPDESHRSPGIFTILKQIELARSIEYDWLYLGYWIKDCQKMSYKACFQPLEAFQPETNTWITVD
jgi:arginine-tRNA-protein transferase